MNVQEFKNFFRSIMNFDPYPFQLEVAHAIMNGKSVVVRAPTGSGKSEAIFIPFLYLYRNKLTGKKFPSQMIYSLPMRVLIESLGERFQKYTMQNFKDLKIAIHHGEKPESELFLEHVIFSTIDQTIGAYCCVPLSTNLRSGNILAGAVSSAFLVFDEVHIYDLEFALQSVLVLLEHSSKLRLPFAILSATIPDSFLKYLETTMNGFSNIKVIDVKDESEIYSRKSRNVEILPQFDLSLKGYLLKNKIPQDKKIIIVCNTVKKSQEIFWELSKRHKNVFLIHSQFTPEDRRKKEKKIKEVFGKESKIKSGVLVSTQIIEVGLDISCDLMISELAPIDSLIQRGGRIARWGGRGKMIVVNLDNNDKNPSYAPYNREIVLKTKEILDVEKKILLSWKKEKELVNKILDKEFEKYLQLENKTKIQEILVQAAFKGERKLVEVALRNPELTCEISVHSNPENLGNNAFYLPRIRISYFKLKTYLEKILSKSGHNENFIWEVIEDNIFDNNRLIDEATLQFKVKPAEEILPYKFYILSPNFVCYNSKFGLVLEKVENFKTKDFKPVIPKRTEETTKAIKSQKKEEKWIDHALKAVRAFNEYFLNDNDFIFKELASSWGIRKNELVNYLRFIIAFHDLGKLNIDWQKEIYEVEGDKWDEEKDPLAHSSKLKIIGIPHATIGAYIIKKCLEKLNLPKEFKRAMIYSIAHHHSPRVYEGRRYKLIPSWKKIMEEIFEEIKVGFNKQDIKFFENIVQENSVKLSKFPTIRDSLYYRTYTIFVRLLRLSDRKSQVI